jgi:magnesium transporter
MIQSEKRDTDFSRSTFRPRVTVGAVPGKLVPSKSKERNQIRVIHYDAQNHFDEVLDSVDDLGPILMPAKADEAANAGNGSDAEFRNKGKRTPAGEVAWINIDGVGDTKLLQKLGKMFNLHPLALEDVVNVHQHAKCECYGNTLFFVARMPIDCDGFQTEQVSIFLVDGVVITIQERPGDCLDPVRNRIANALGRIRKRGSDYLAYSIIDAIIDGYFPVLERYAHELDRSGGEELRENRHLPIRLHEVRADLLMIRKIVNQHSNAVIELIREGEELISSDTLLYFRDCQDHIHQLIEAADTDRETCGELRELYFALLGEKNNDVMKVLTIIATIFIPMSFVAGLYGMNFDSNVSTLNMPELQWTFGYPFALGVMGVLAAGLVFYLYRKGWLW